VDHVGNAQLLAEASGAPVWIHDGDREKVAGESAWERWAPRYTAYLRRQGVPEEQLPRLVAIWKHSGKFSRRIDPQRVRSLVEGQHFRFARIEVEVMHLPGHTPGLVCLWDAEHRLLFADDHVLARTSPNPFLELRDDGTTFRALVHYFQSIRRVQALDVAWVLPGHGEPFQEHRALIDRMFGFYQRRQEKLLRALQDGPRTTAALSEAVFGTQEGSRLYLTLSEVIGNLEVLEEDGRVRRIEDGPVDLWAGVN
jgi:glyoxylase-like metal-dependent hydrolase (beta-lactamase superfamily II)